MPIVRQINSYHAQWTAQVDNISQSPGKSAIRSHTTMATYFCLPSTRLFVSILFGLVLFWRKQENHPFQIHVDDNLDVTRCTKEEKHSCSQHGQYVLKLGFRMENPFAQLCGTLDVAMKIFYSVSKLGSNFFNWSLPCTGLTYRASPE